MIMTTTMGFMILLCSCFIAPLLVTGADQYSSCDFPAIFNFGDSNSDTGGWSAGFGQAGSPHGESFFGGPKGRYCDGRLLIDFIAEGLGLPYLSPFLDSLGSNFSHGANFATAGSTVRPQKSDSGLSPVSLNVQYYEFSDFFRRSQEFLNQGGVFAELMPKAEYFSKALYTFDIGQNDLTAGFSSLDGLRADFPDILNQFADIVTWVYGIGGRSFWIHNTGPVGCLPYILDQMLITAGQVDKVGCASPFNEIAQEFNKLLKQKVDKLRNDLPEAAITFVDIYSNKHSLFTHARKNGFVHPLRACCGHGGKYNYNAKIGCGMTKMIDGKKVMIGKACNDPSKAVVWDGVHLTQAANKFIYDKIVDGSFSDNKLSINMACHRV